MRPVSLPRDGLLRLAAGLESASEHPLARPSWPRPARKLTIPAVSDFENHTGKGITGRVEGQAIAIGQDAFMAGLGVSTAELAPEAERLRKAGATVSSWRWTAPSPASSPSLIR